MTPEVVTVTREELRAWRAEVLTSLGLTAEEWETVKATRTLTGDQWAAKEDLDAIAFLLGDDA